MIYADEYIVKKEELTAIADAIRDKTLNAETITTAEMPGKIGEVYEAGKKAEYDAFWNYYQDNGNKEIYDYAFSGRSWTVDTFKPKYDIRPTRAQHMFSQTGIKGDLVALCEQLGIVVDFSKCKLFSTFASNAQYVTRFGVIDATKATDTIAFINCYKLETIDKLIVSTTTKYSAAMFSGDDKLTKLIVEGEIGQKDFNVSYCPKLSLESIESIINALSASTSGLTVTLSKTAKEAAFTDEEWATLIATKSNWTISLA